MAKYLVVSIALIVASFSFTEQRLVCKGDLCYDCVVVWTVFKDARGNAVNASYKTQCKQIGGKNEVTNR